MSVMAAADQPALPATRLGAGSGLLAENGIMRSPEITNTFGDRAVDDARTHIDGAA
jgi:hypothetical protein